MSHKLPVLFWIHSPIAYESFLAFQRSYTSGLVIPATSRNIDISDAVFQLGYPGLYQHQTPEQIDCCSRAIATAMETLLNKHNAYALAIPQSAQPYIEALIESPYCQGYIYYDEGAACYEPDFYDCQAAVYHRYVMQHNEGFSKLAGLLQIDIERLHNRHRQGVPFFNFKHPKYIGCFSFFENAFPGQQTTILPRPDTISNASAICSEYSIILANDLLNSSTNSEREIHLHNIAVMYELLQGQVVVKSHPSDIENNVCKIIGGNKPMWSDFCKKYHIDPNREVAFMGFKQYITRNNSTSLYLKNMGLKNFLSIY